MDLEEFKYKTLNGMEAAENLVWSDPEMAADLLVYLTKGN